MLLNCGAGEDSWEYRGLGRRSNQSILKEINTEYSLEVVMVNLKLQYFGLLMQRTDSFEKTLVLGKTEGRQEVDDRRWDCWMASLTPWAWIWASSRNCWWIGKPGVLQSMGLQKVGHNWATELNHHDNRQLSLWNIYHMTIKKLPSIFHFLNSKIQAISLQKLQWYVCLLDGFLMRPI